MQRPSPAFPTPSPTPPSPSGEFSPLRSWLSFGKIPKDVGVFGSSFGKSPKVTWDRG